MTSNQKNQKNKLFEDGDYYEEQPTYEGIFEWVIMRFEAENSKWKRILKDKDWGNWENVEETPRKREMRKMRSRVKAIEYMKRSNTDPSKKD